MFPIYAARVAPKVRGSPNAAAAWHKAQARTKKALRQPKPKLKLPNGRINLTQVGQRVRSWHTRETLKVRSAQAIQRARRATRPLNPLAQVGKNAAKRTRRRLAAQAKYAPNFNHRTKGPRIATPSGELFPPRRTMRDVGKLAIQLAPYAIGGGAGSLTRAALKRYGPKIARTVWGKIIAPGMVDGAVGEVADKGINQKRLPNKKELIKGIRNGVIWEGFTDTSKLKP